MEARELRQRSTEDLRKELTGLSREAFNLRMQKATGQLSNSSRVGQVRRDIARIKTVLNERERSSAT
ncbi:MAG: 50S ribosomal protein L29 [Chromatiales bacterium]|nr:50S ribosomal protein L29 [Chromatiales bacterium]